MAPAVAPQPAAAAPLAKRLTTAGVRDAAFIETQCGATSLRDLFAAVRDLDDEWMRTRVCTHLARRLGAADTVADLRAMLTMPEATAAAQRQSDDAAERTARRLFE